MQANPEYMPIDWNGFMFKQDNDYETVLDINAQAREEINYKKGLFYICIVG